MDCAMLQSQHGYSFSPGLSRHGDLARPSDSLADMSQFQHPLGSPGRHQDVYAEQMGLYDRQGLRAVPIRTPTGHYEGQGVGNVTSPRTGLSENMLRRKTPNGTLNGAFQCSSQDTNPMKYMVMPGYRRTPAELPQMDSVLQQTLSHPAHFHRPYGESIPSLLQSPAHFLGPTASGIDDRGPYGPYWHDGTYVPYRPNALRDPRFYSDQTSLWQPVGQHHGQPSHFSNGQQGPLQRPRYFPRPHRIDTGVQGPVGLQGPSFHDGRVQGQTFGSNDRFDSIETPTTPTQRSYSFQQQHPFFATPFTIQSLHQPSSLPISSENSPDFSSTSINAQQREAIFNRALQIYRELLSFIHQVKRQNHLHATSRENHSHVRPSFYPRPPSSTTGHAPQPPHHGLESPLSKFDFQHAQHETVSSTHVATRHPHHAHPQVRSTPTTPYGPSPWPPQTDGQISRRLSSGLPYPHPKQQFAWPYPQAQSFDRSNNLHRPHTSSVQPIPHPHIPQESPVSKAKGALSTLQGLCLQTDWQWIDGMNLGGCLAYALGLYPRAFELYTKVLVRDSRHIEATSNIAATLLALGRKPEAEQHWMKVVKIAPNHFEAVEHLIGLLCSSSRSKEAIKVIENVQRSLRTQSPGDGLRTNDHQSESSSSASRSPCVSEISDRILFESDGDGEPFAKEHSEVPGAHEPGFGSSGYAIPGRDNGRMLALAHAKGNLLYSQGDNGGAARAFEDAVLIATGRKHNGIKGLVRNVLSTICASASMGTQFPFVQDNTTDPVLLHPDQAVQTARLCFPHDGQLPGLAYLPGDSHSIANKAAVSTTSNSLLSLAKIFQDSMSTNSRTPDLGQLVSGVREILALYYLSISLQSSPSTANNVGILLAGVQQSAPAAKCVAHHRSTKPEVAGVTPGSGIALALAYYNYGLQLDSNHAHLYTNLGSLLKDIGHLDAAIEMYKRAVSCDGKFDIALANLANAVKDKGRISEAIEYYKRAVDVNPDFAEAVCGLANALNSVCGWRKRGGIALDRGKRDRWHVDDQGMLLDATQPGASSSGWIKRVVDIVEKQLTDGEEWGIGVLTPTMVEEMVLHMVTLDGDAEDYLARMHSIRQTLRGWAGQRWEGARIVRLVERATRRITWHWYQDKYIRKKERKSESYSRPQLPPSLTIPPAPTVLPFHTFTCPMSAKQVRLISQRNGYRISASTLRTSWLSPQVYPPPPPPSPHLKVGYVSSDFNNHPLAHLMQSAFGLHDINRVEAFCYATTASDNSIHRKQIESEAPNFIDASSWSTERLVKQIVLDGIHVLVNLNGYTRGARNEVFAARPAPIQMSFMGFAGTLGAEWCDYLLADDTAIPPSTLRPWRRNVDLEDQVVDENSGGVNEDWVYGENIIFCRDTFFCCDHKQSAPDSQDGRLSWNEEEKRRWAMRKELFPHLPEDAIIFGNFNQLYKIEPTTFRTWLRILSRVSNSILWLLRFPDLGEANLINTARIWAGHEVASRVIFTDVAPKNMHISRARVCDLFLDTPECNAHTTAADVLWSGTPLLTLPRYDYKMCSRMAASILRGALPKDRAERKEAERDLIAESEEEYEELAVRLGSGLRYGSATQGTEGQATGRLMELRKLLTNTRWSSALFDTRRWVSDLEDAYDEAWRRWVAGEGGDIWLADVPRGRRG